MKTFDVGVIGLGYVGLTLATAMAEVGLTVVGVEKHAEIVKQTNAGEPHFSETGLEDALIRVTRARRFVASQMFEPNSSCSTYIITVGTPLDAEGRVRLDMIEAATLQVAENMNDGALVILRSTVKCGTARQVVSPILERSGKRFDIAMCPERTLEGCAMRELRELPQIVGADTQEARYRAAALFRRLTNSVIEVSSLESAEVIKLVDNTYRDVQFAFSNEVARVCDAVGVNAYEVIANGKLGYQRTNVPLPGLVGGPCLEKDPHILIQSAHANGVALEVTSAARLVNERQPFETVTFISAQIEKRGFSKEAPIAILGMAFKGVPATDDLRGSMSIKVLNALRKARPEAPIRLYDPVVNSESLAKIAPDCKICSTRDEATIDAAAVLIANNHPDFGEFAPVDTVAGMRKNGFIYDYWNHFSARSKSELGTSYMAVGNTQEGML